MSKLAIHENSPCVCSAAFFDLSLSKNYPMKIWGPPTLERILHAQRPKGIYDFEKPQILHTQALEAWNLEKYPARLQVPFRSCTPYWQPASEASKDALQVGGVRGAITPISLKRTLEVITLSPLSTYLLSDLDCNS